MSHVPTITRTVRNAQPREILSIRMEATASNFMPRLLACLAIAQGREAYQARLAACLHELNAELGLVIKEERLAERETAEEVATAYLRRHGKFVVGFGPCDAARIWAAGPRGHLLRETIGFWRNVEPLFRSRLTTSELRRKALAA